MPNKSIFSNKSLWLPHTLFFVGLCALLFISDPGPKIKSISQNIAPGDPISIVFTEPIQTVALSEKIHVSLGAESVSGKVEASSTSVAFYPEAALRSGETYTLRIDPVQAFRGNARSNGFFEEVVVRGKTLFYLNMENRLVRKDFSRNKETIITPENIEINDFDLGKDGRFVGRYGLKGDLYKNGIILGKPRVGKDDYDLVLSPLTSDTRYSTILLCDRDEQALLLYLANDSHGSDDIGFLDMHWEKSGEAMMEPRIKLSGVGSYGGNDIACSSESARFSYRRSNSDFAAGFIGEGDEELLGTFDALLGFAPRDRFLAFEKNFTGVGGSIDTKISLLGSEDENFDITEPGRFFGGLSFDGNGNRLAVWYTEALSGRTSIIIYNYTKDGFKKNASFEAPKGLRINRADLSSDGTSVAIETANENDYKEPPSIKLWEIGEEEAKLEVPQGKSPEWLY